MLLQFLLQLSQRLASVADLVLFLRTHLREGFVAVLEYRVVAEAAVTDKLVSDLSLAGFLDLELLSVG